MSHFLSLFYTMKIAKFSLKEVYSLNKKNFALIWKVFKEDHNIDWMSEITKKFCQLTINIIITNGINLKYDRRGAFVSK